MNMRISVTLASVLSIAAAAGAYIGQWHSFTNKDITTCLQPFGNRLFVGTTGGIRNVDPVSFKEATYDNRDGLLDVDVVAMAVSPANRLWAASRSGFLYEWDQSRWHPYGRGYVVERWKPNDRAMLAAGKYLVLGTDKGLTIFDTDIKLSRVNLTKFANQAGLSILSLLRKNDTLFIGTPQGVFKAAVDWGDVMSLKYSSILDPQSWSPVELPPLAEVIVPPPPDPESEADSNEAEVSIDSLLAPPRKYNFMAFVDGRLETYPAGTRLEEPFHVEAFLGYPLKIGSEAMPSLAFFSDAAVMSGNLFLGSPFGLVAVREPTGSKEGKIKAAKLLSGDLPLEKVVNISSAGSHTFAMTERGLFRIERSNWVKEPAYDIYSPDIYFYGLRNLVADRDGAAYIGSWGHGFLREKDGKETRWNVSNNPCMDTVLVDYTVVSAMSGIHDRGLWGTLPGKLGSASHSLVYLDLDQEKVTCTGLKGSGDLARNVKALSDTVVGVSTEKGLDLYTFKKFGEILRAKFWKTITLGGSSETWDAEADSQDRIWSLMSGQLVYADSLDSAKGPTQTPKTVDDFAGKDCRQMDADASGSLWIGCSNGLFRYTPAEAVEASRSERFTLDDGLLSYSIFDVSVNKEDGKVWVATELGVSMYESDSRPPAPSADDIKVYPNPFRQKHKYVVFDKLPRGAQVRIHTQSGNIVRAFSSAQIKGGQCQWDGANAAGSKVKPGIYLYSVQSGGKTRNGKIIVAR